MNLDRIIEVAVKEARESSVDPIYAVGSGPANLSRRRWWTRPAVLVSIAFVATVVVVGFSVAVLRGGGEGGGQSVIDPPGIASTPPSTPTPVTDGPSETEVVPTSGALSTQTELSVTMLNGRQLVLTFEPETLWDLRNADQTMRAQLGFVGGSLDGHGTVIELSSVESVNPPEGGEAIDRPSGAAGVMTFEPSLELYVFSWSENGWAARVPLPRTDVDASRVFSAALARDVAVLTDETTGYPVLSLQGSVSLLSRAVDEAGQATLSFVFGEGAGTIDIVNTRCEPGATSLVEDQTRWRGEWCLSDGRTQVRVSGSESLAQLAGSISASDG